MALTRQEQRILADIEQELAADEHMRRLFAVNPKAQRHLMLQAAAAFAVGLAILICGTVLLSGVARVVTGLAGYVLLCFVAIDCVCRRPLWLVRRAPCP